MRTTRKEMVEIIMTTYKCDFCDFSIDTNKGCCGSAPIMKCNVCEKDMCHDHRHYYEEGGGDYPDLVVCSECNKVVEPAWEWAEDNAGRYDDISEVTLNRVKVLQVALNRANELLKENGEVAERAKASDSKSEEP